MKVSRSKQIAALLIFVATAAYSQNGGDIVIGRKVSLQSSILANEIELSIHVPESHDATDARYPVLFTFQTHFEQVAGAVKNLYDYSLTPEMIVVRIDNYEFGYLTPTPVEGDPNTGQADRFLDFFDKELFPFVDSSYPTHPYRIVFSNSWGAMFVAYAVLNRPSVFNAGLASVPWITYDDEEHFFLKNAKRFMEGKTYNNFLYMAMDDELEYVPDLPLFVDLLRDNPAPGLDWEYYHWPEEDHTSTPYRSVYSGLRALYAGWSDIPEEVSSGGVEEIKKYELLLNGKFGYDIGVSGAALRLAGQSLQKQSQNEKAIAVYEYAVEKDPEDAFVYVTLGRALEEDGQLERALRVYETAYRVAETEADPQIKWIKNFLDRLREKMETGNR